MNVTVCTHACDRAAYDARLYDMAAQLAALTVERDRLAAQLTQAQAEAREWQDAYQGAVESAAFHLAGFEQATRKAAR